MDCEECTYKREQYGIGLLWYRNCKPRETILKKRATFFLLTTLNFPITFSLNSQSPLPIQDVRLYSVHPEVFYKANFSKDPKASDFKALRLRSSFKGLRAHGTFSTLEVDI